jgi:ABC-type transporter lipoprotein component MlaA/pimeloyl-ACP methyl ester carboxylesterase
MKSTLKFCCRLALVLFISLCAGCTAIPEPVTPQEQETLSLTRIKDQVAGSDPCEPFNRAMFAVTDFGMTWIADPLGRIYCTILPRPVIECIDSACHNLEYPGRAVSCLLRAEWKGALDETIRFLFNTVVGIAGFFDPAKNWLNIYSTDSNFGQAFAQWGIGPGCTFVLPFSSAVNVRDTVGMLFDVIFDCKTYIPYCGWATGLNRMVMAQDKYTDAVDGSFDTYKTFQEMSLLYREMQQDLWLYRELNRRRDEHKKLAVEQNTDKPEYPALPPEEPVVKPAGLKARWIELPGYHSTDPVTDSMRSTLFKEIKQNDFWYMPLSLFNSDFQEQRKTRKIILEKERPALRYGFWKAPEPKEGEPVPPEKLVIFLPGIGGTYFSRTPAAFAERFHLRGAKVVILNSLFTWQFNRSRAKGELPGFLPHDAELLQDTILKVIEDLKNAELIDDPEITVAGYSFGAMHTLKLADLELKNGKTSFARFVAINPPVSLDLAMTRADGLLKGAAKGDFAEMRDKFVNAAGNYMLIHSIEYPPYVPGLPGLDPRNYRITIPEGESRVMVGLNLRNSMRELMLSAHQKSPLPGIKNDGNAIRKNHLYLELDRVTFRNYAEKMLMPKYPMHDRQQIYALCDLRSIEQTLANDPRITVFHNFDDFLLSDDDRNFLDRTLGRKLIWFNHGGHLGNFYIKLVQDKIADQIVFGKEKQLR